MAVGLVLAGAAILRRSLGQAGRAPELETLSHGLVALVGLWMLWHAFRHRHHVQTAEESRSGPILALVAGFIPCPLTTFIMTWAVLNGAVAAGLLLSAAFAAGMIATVMLSPLVAVFLRRTVTHTGALPLDVVRQLGRALAVTAALAVTLVGVWPLLLR